MCGMNVPPTPSIISLPDTSLSADRKAGAPLRCHGVESVADLHVPYVYPSKPCCNNSFFWLIWHAVLLFMLIC